MCIRDSPKRSSPPKSLFRFPLMKTRRDCNGTWVRQYLFRARKCGLRPFVGTGERRTGFTVRIVYVFEARCPCMLSEWRTIISSIKYRRRWIIIKKQKKTFYKVNYNLINFNLII